MIRDNREYWLYIDSNILVDTVVFYEGVTWSEYEVWTKNLKEIFIEP